MDKRILKILNFFLFFFNNIDKCWNGDGDLNENLILKVHYQPKINLKPDDIYIVEVLVRFSNSFYKFFRKYKRIKSSSRLFNSCYKQWF